MATAVKKEQHHFLLPPRLFVPPPFLRGSNGSLPSISPHTCLPFGGGGGGVHIGSARLITCRSLTSCCAPRPRAANNGETERPAVAFNMFPGPDPHQRRHRCIFMLHVRVCGGVCRSEASRCHKLLNTFVLLTFHHLLADARRAAVAAGDAALGPSLARYRRSCVRLIHKQ